jgi:S-DNA-T family DNA segregation ATPase FtsK/SpoIIIE
MKNPLSSKRRRDAQDRTDQAPSDPPPPLSPSATATAAELPSPGAMRRAAHGFAREASAVLLMASALYTVLALASYRADPQRADVHGSDWVGPVGAGVAELLVASVGVIAWLLPVELIALALPMLGARTERPRGWMAWSSRLGGDVVVATVMAALVHVAMPEATAFGAMPLGGLVGELAGELMRSLFSAVGSFIIGLTIVALILVGRASFSFIETVVALAQGARAAGEKGAVGAAALADAWAQARALESEGEAKREPLIVDEKPDAIVAALSDDSEPDPLHELDGLDPEPLDAAEGGAFTLTLLRSTPEVPASRPLVELAPEPNPAFVASPLSPDEVPTPSPLPAAPPKRVRVVKPAEPEPPKKLAQEARGHVETPPRPPPKKAPPTKKEDQAEAGLKIVDTSHAREVERGDKVIPSGTGFHLPSFEFLDPPEGGVVEVHADQLKATAVLLEKTLSDYGVSGKVEEIHPGPTVTTFEVSPAAGTKVSKVASLADDLALGLSRKVRIIAPIPGKNRIGFEIPNPKRVPVNMRELVEDRRFLEMKAPLPCVLGRDIVGAPYFADLASMPHVIVAGATGAGKSVGLNVILVSLLYRRTPDELKMLMIDPKVVELAPFDGIPHMLLPVVTDMKQAATALKWAVDEMERRYQLFANAGTKNITTYNGFVERVLRGEAKPPKPLPGKVNAIAADGTDVELDPAKDGSDAELLKKLPFIVIVVDEFADLMMQQGKEVEVSVARLAQKARAAGMHVILATQRPSVDVITGMIKANFPTRVAFRVAQKVDSRTILDEQGAEHLLGRGDMLIKMNGSNDTRRVQCPFISEEEAQKVTDFLRLQGTPEYDENILKPRDEDGKVEADDEEDADPLYDQAVRIVADTRRCSTSWLQRKLGIGYNRAAKLVETMERRGLVGPANGSKDREVLIEAL